MELDFQALLCAEIQRQIIEKIIDSNLEFFRK